MELITKFRKKRALKKVPSRILAWGNCQNPHIFDYDKNGIIHSHSQDLRFSSSARPRSKRLRRVLLVSKSANAICGLGRGRGVLRCKNCTISKISFNMFFAIFTKVQILSHSKGLVFRFFRIWFLHGFETVPNSHLNVFMRSILDLTQS